MIRPLQPVIRPLQPAIRPAFSASISKQNLATSTTPSIKPSTSDDEFIEVVNSKAVSHRKNKNTKNNWQSFKGNK